MHSPSKVSQNRVQVEQEYFVEEMDIRDVDNLYIAGLGVHYARHGIGPVHLSVAYDKTHENAAKASSDAARIATMLQDEGVRDVRSNVMPVSHLGPHAKVMISYTAYNALAPKDCSLMSGIESAQIEPEQDYRLGCSIETLFAQQIARPKDLAGGDMGERITDGRRSANIVEGYRSGAPGDALSGENASD